MTNLSMEEMTGMKLSEAAYEALMGAILSGELPTGEPVSELELARRLGISRTPVHEAVLELVKDGLMDHAPNCRPVVAAFTETDVDEIFEMRKVLEGEAASRAAQRMDKHTLAQLRGTADELAKIDDDAAYVARWTEYDDEFHAAIARMCGVRRLEQDIVRYRRLHRFFNRAHTTAAVLRQALAEHVAILDALDARDSDAARNATVDHIQEWQRYFLKQIGERATR